MTNKKQTGKNAETKSADKAQAEKVEWKELAKIEIGQQGNLTVQAAKVDKIVNGTSEGIVYTLSKVGKKKGGEVYKAQLFSVNADLAYLLLAPSVIEALNPNTEAAAPQSVAPKRAVKAKAAGANG